MAEALAERERESLQGENGSLAPHTAVAVARLPVRPPGSRSLV